MATIPNTDSGKDSWGPSGPPSASNGVAPGQKGNLLRGQGAIGGAQEANHQPTMVAHPHGPYVGRDGQRFRMASK